MKQTPHHPQRLSPLSLPGTLAKTLSVRGVKRKLKDITGRDPTYLALVRQCPCLKCGLDPCYEAAHVRLSSAAHGKRGGMGKKPEDRFALPLCAACHTQDADSQHKIGEREFWHRVGLNPLLVCDRLHQRRGDVVAMRAVIFASMAERESIMQHNAKAILGESLASPLLRRNRDA